jgi:hypothetical protein
MELAREEKWMDKVLYVIAITIYSTFRTLKDTVLTKCKKFHLYYFN